MDHFVNEKIQANNILLVNVNGEMLGERTLEESILIAKEAGLDLIQVTDDEKPVCKMGDLKKKKYQEKKKKKENVQKKLKEIRFNLETGKNDILTKVKQANKFLKSGHPLKILMQLKKRQKKENAVSLLNNILSQIESSYVIQNNKYQFKKEGVAVNLMPLAKK